LLGCSGASFFFFVGSVSGVFPYGVRISSVEWLRPFFRGGRQELFLFKWGVVEIFPAFFCVLFLFSSPMFLFFLFFSLSDDFLRRGGEELCPGSLLVVGRFFARLSSTPLFFSILFLLPLFNWGLDVVVLFVGLFGVVWAQAFFLLFKVFPLSLLHRVSPFLLPAGIGIG